MLYSRKQLAELLNTSVDNIKKLEKRKKLEDRLNKNGYYLIKVHKEGRGKTYEVVELNQNKVIKNNIYKYVFNVSKFDKFERYFKVRTYNTDKPLTLEYIADKCETNRQAISRWDNKLINNDILYKDGFYYMYIDNITGDVYEIPKEKYNEYWKNKAYLKTLKSLQNRFLNGDIDLNEFQVLSIQVGNLKATLDKGYVYKVKKFRLNDDNQLYKDIVKLMRGESNFGIEE